jgi:hypothetical protein
MTHFFGRKKGYGAGPELVIVSFSSNIFRDPYSQPTFCIWGLISFTVTFLAGSVRRLGGGKQKRTPDSDREAVFLGPGQARRGFRSRTESWMSFLLV